MIESARRMVSVLETTPYAARLGLRAGEITSQAVTASVPYAARLANAQGFVHGGVAASLSVWTAMMAALASDRDDAAAAHPVSVSISYLSAAREEALEATARLTTRGRDVAHVTVDIASGRGREVATALLVMCTSAGGGAVRRSRAAVPVPVPVPGEDREEIARRISPFTQGLGIALRAHDASSARMSMRLDGNDGLGGAVDPGALLALADTCAALACVPSLDERLTASATLSMSAVFGSPVCAAPLATGRLVAESGSMRSALVEIAADNSPAAVTACVAYRFL